MPPISHAFDITFLTLQAIVVAFLLLHDWIPLGRLSNITAIHNEDSVQRRIFVTLLPAVPAAIGLFYSAKYFGRAYPDGLEMLLRITYVVFLFGILRAWWIPYLLIPEPARAARYQIIFANTHTFLPKRNGMAPDTLHTVFHIATVATVIGLFIRDRMLHHLF
jgi:hypothetical protein